jgi:hypothetical protein
MKVLIRLGAWIALGLSAVAQVPQPTITFVSPPHNGVAAVDTDILIHFDAGMDQTTFVAPNRFRVFGEQSGPASGDLIFEPGKRHIRFEPHEDFIAGETVRVTLSNQILSLRKINLRPAGYVLEFRTQTAPAAMDFRPIDGMSVRQTPGEAVRIYGGLGSDFDDDGFIDLALVNEDSGDFRMIQNNGDGSGHFALDFSATQSLGQRPSPSDVADFNVDGLTDAVASNTQLNDVSVLFGLGGATFTPALNLTTDFVPRGLGVIEANGDGFTDIITANFTDGTGNVTLMLNDGAGGFLPATTFDVGISSEWALDVADMNADAIQDIVVAGRDAQTVVVLLGDGQGGFTFQSSQPTGGLTWRLYCADVNNDGSVDVTGSNGLTGNAFVALNEGGGNLAAPVVYPTDGFSTDTDLCDLDGDGDLDWIVSNFSGRNYILFLNDGAGGFTQHDVWDAIDRPAGVIPMDFDRDGDLDLALLDEIGDYVTFMENQSGPTSVFCFGDGSGTSCPCGNVGDPGHGCENLHGTGGVNFAVSSVTPAAGGDMAEVVADGFNPAATVPFIPIRGATVANGGNGAVFGDGLACVGAPVIRLPVRFGMAGSQAWTMLHLSGPGTFHYQLVYRSQGNFCDPSQFNTSNGLTINWP